MKTLENIGKKPWLIITLTLIIGLLIGYIIGENVSNNRYESYLNMKTVDGFKENYLKLINPDKMQKAAIEEVIDEYARKNSQLIEAFSDSIRKLKAEMNSELAPKLKEEQKQRITNEDIKKTDRNTNQNIHTRKEQIKPNTKITKDENLVLKNKKVIERIEKRIDERSLILKQELNLNDEQFAKVNSLNQEFTLQFIKLKNDTTQTDFQKKTMIRELRKELIQEMKQILTIDQFEKFKKMGKEKLKQIKNEY